MTEATRQQLERAAELLRRAMTGEDSVTYCLAWAAHHITIATAAVLRDTSS